MFWALYDSDLHCMFLTCKSLLYEAQDTRFYGLQL